LKQVGFADAFQYVEDNSHPVLWRIVADAALKSLDLQAALKGYVRCQDYNAIQFVKRLQLLEDKRKQDAEIQSFFHEFDKSEEIYMNMERIDLAVELRLFLGDWFNILNIIKENPGKYTNETLVDKAKSSLGDYFFERQKWFNAGNYYSESQVYDRLGKCHYFLENYGGIEKILDTLPDRHYLLPVCFSSIIIIPNSLSKLQKCLNLLECVNWQ
jgi:WD repeat-containing protein 35